MVVIRRMLTYYYSTKHKQVVRPRGDGRVVDYEDIEEVKDDINGVKETEDKIDVVKIEEKECLS